MKITRSDLLQTLLKVNITMNIVTGKQRKTNIPKTVGLGCGDNPYSRPLDVGLLQLLCDNEPEHRRPVGPGGNSIAAAL